MKLQIKYDINTACQIILKQQLTKLEIPFEINGLGEVEIKSQPGTLQYTQLQSALKEYGIEIIDNHKKALVQKVKDAIMEMIYSEDKLSNFKTSVFLSDKLKFNYTYLANLFSEVTYSSIENFIILQKLERAKQFLIENKLTITEVSLQLNYSSVAHLSSQFKKYTGLSPTTFQRIINKRLIAY